jgi:uncharacterized membrane protein
MVRIATREGWRIHRMGYGRCLDTEDILRQRYVRGEITKEQYEQMLRDLLGTR